MKTFLCFTASLSSVATPIGCIVSGYLLDAIGRKRTLILTLIPMMLGWALISAATSVYYIYAGRLLIGLGAGMVGSPARVYTAEITQPHLRGMLAAVASVGVSFGKPTDNLQLFSFKFYYVFSESCEYNGTYIVRPCVK